MAWFVWFGWFGVTFLSRTKKKSLIQQQITKWHIKNFFSSMLLIILIFPHYINLAHIHTHTLSLSLFLSLSQSISLSFFSFRYLKIKPCLTLYTDNHLINDNLWPNICFKWFYSVKSLILEISPVFAGQYVWMPVVVGLKPIIFKQNLTWTKFSKCFSLLFLTPVPLNIINIVCLL